MARIQLFVGGSRSGKSALALRTGAALAGPRCFLATCPVIDDEMQARIERHQEARALAGAWDTVEEPLDLARRLAELHHPVVLVDCLALWVNNLLFHEGASLDEDDVARHAAALVAASRRRSGEVLLVTSEVGMGIVPGDPVSRRYRDLLGRCNQCVAAEADAVTLLSCGLAVSLKPSSARPAS